MAAFIDAGYFVATLTFVGGLKFLSSPAKAKSGNILAAIGMTLAVALTFYSALTNALPAINMMIILGAIGIGTVVGKLMSSRVEMTGMPQLVSLFNAMGGGCAMLLGIIEGQQVGVSSLPLNVQLLLAGGLVIGAASLTGSMVAYFKLAGKLKDNRNRALIYMARTSLVLILGLLIAFSFGLLPISFVNLIYILALLSLLYGVLFVWPIGGADMPVVISLLNSLTGVATALAGLVYANKIMIAGGIFVGAAGLLLTLLMCKAMNRSLLKVLAGTFAKGKGAAGVTEEIHIKETSSAETAMQLAFAQKVAIIPGYGLAVAQAQHACGQLQKILEERGVELHYIIHPVAGRMPGHMNVLLAEANINYDFLKEMDEVNDEMDQYDLVVIVGANDVVNPSAENDENSPVYGMPIIRAYQSKQVVVIKRGMSTGYAGVENTLFGADNCNLLFGDAKATLQDLVGQLKLI
ncbi:NAD(P)(+) transhydrogenase (Re/Si-specific) subunit beta [Owenweeksia hongkongensis]|uniref:NAD(P)(+) transhydrogenase (Re/Si-specific) subunit beta n=1 Tax=Owenweeksia hongkongensis TaxID=253245 RepID=UPI003A958208